jgi:antitoxin ParD1/3/4
VRFQKKHVTNLACYHFLVTLAKIKSMGRNTSISLGNHFESFIEKTVNNGRFNNASEVVRAGLRLLEDEENRIISLRQAIQEGIDSGVAEDFEPKAFLKSLKARNK